MAGMSVLGTNGVDIRFLGSLWEHPFPLDLDNLYPELIHFLNNPRSIVYLSGDGSGSSQALPEDKKMTRQMWLEEWLE
jgi:hypothetical protein